MTKEEIVDELASQINSYLEDWRDEIDDEYGSVRMETTADAGNVSLLIAVNVYYSTDYRRGASYWEEDEYDATCSDFDIDDFVVWVDAEEVEDFITVDDIASRICID